MEPEMDYPEMFIKVKGRCAYLLCSQCKGTVLDDVNPECIGLDGPADSIHMVRMAAMWEECNGEPNDIRCFKCMKG